MPRTPAISWHTQNGTCSRMNVASDFRHGIQSQMPSSAPNISEETRISVGT